MNEPLADSAPLAWVEAPRRCHRDPVTAETCLWYHQVWQYLRLLGVISTIRTNTDFLTRVFRDLARTGEYRRVLISGAADYSMLAHLKCSYDQERGELDATVLDRCDTSLFLNGWYADRHQMRLDTVCANALESAPEGPFDLVCTHNFLGRFDARARRRLIARWRELLRPGGVVVTTLRIRPNDPGERSIYTDDQARHLGDRVAGLARAYRPQLDVDPDELARAVYEYAIRKGGYVIRSNREITDVFENEGFEMLLADEGQGPVEREVDRPSSTAGTDTYRMRLVARTR